MLLYLKEQPLVVSEGWAVAAQGGGGACKVAREQQRSQLLLGRGCALQGRAKDPVQVVWAVPAGALYTWGDRRDSVGPSFTYDAMVLQLLDHKPVQLLAVQLAAGTHCGRLPGHPSHVQSPVNES